MERLGRYHLAREVAATDFASVHRAYLATAAGVVRPVTIRRVLPAFASKPEVADLLIEEARVCAMLEHTHIPAVLDVDQQGGVWFSVEERVLGQDLGALLRRVKQRGIRIDIASALYFCVQILDALAHVHARTDADGNALGIVHRDVSPGNVFVSFGGEVKLGGFSYAKLRTRPSPPAPGLMHPRYAYVSPEQAMGSEVDHRSDIFSVGLIAYELVTGNQAYESKTDLEALARAQRGHVPPLDGNSAPAVSGELRDLIERALVFDRRARHPSAAAFRDELARILYVRDPTYGTDRLTSLMVQAFAEEAEEERAYERAERAELNVSGRPPSSISSSMSKSAVSPIPKAPPPAPPPPSSAAISATFTPPPPILSDPGLDLGPGLVVSKTPAPVLSRTPAPVLSTSAPADAMHVLASTGQMPPMVKQHVPLAQIALAAQAPIARTPLPLTQPQVPMELAPMAPIRGSERSERKFGVATIVIAVLLLAAAGLTAFTYSSEKNHRFMSRKMRAIFIGRQEGGILTVESLPTNAKISVDDEDTGRRTPLIVENLESGVVHDLLLTLDNGETTSSTVSIRAGSKGSITVMFESLVVPMTITSDPAGAEVWVDNKQVALAPASLVALVGQETTVRLTRVGYVDTVKKITAEKGTPVVLAVTMEKTKELMEAEAAEAAAIKEAEDEAAQAEGGKKKKRPH